MKKQLSIAITILVIIGTAAYVGYSLVSKKYNNAPAIPPREYSFDKIGIKFSVPEDMGVIGEDSRDDIFTVTVQRGNYPEQNYYQLYGILQPTSNPTFDIESVKGEPVEGAKNTTIGGFAAVQGQYTGERNNLVTIIFTNKGIFRLTTAPPSAESEAITNSILNTLKFTFSDNPTMPSSGTRGAVQNILANKYNRPASEVQVTIKKEAPGYSSGSVKFGQGGVGEGGVWLAVQKDEIWQVVFDGNGSVDCNKMRKEYGFPDVILKPDFCDSKANMTQEEAIRIAQGTQECSMAGILSDRASYNPNSKTWWIDLDRMPELEKDGCNPACVVSEQTKTAEVNWRCTGLKEPEVTACEPEQRNADVCTTDYNPVCAKVNVQCITAPCDPVNETFSNACEACKNPLVESYVVGECK